MQQEPATVTTNKKMISLASDGIPLAVAGSIRPVIGIRVVAEETHGERGTTTDRAIGCHGHPHDMRAFTRIVEANFSDPFGRSVFDRQNSID